MSDIEAAVFITLAIWISVLCATLFGIQQYEFRTGERFFASRAEVEAEDRPAAEPTNLQRRP